MSVVKKKGSILIVDDNKGVLSALQLLLRPYFEQIVTLPSPTLLPAALQKSPCQLVLLDMNFSAGINSGNEGLYWLHEIKHMRPALPVVLFTAYADINLAVKGIKEGATDFIVKPWDNQQLIETLLNAVKTEQPASIKTPSSSAMYWGESPAMKQLYNLARKVAPTDANILITGENGTGKEVMAREIHAMSARGNREMITVDMGAIAPTLFESELFGHVKGAFTDAHADRPGKFEAANHSTLFMDEIGNLPYHLQAKLLTAIQRRSIIRVGSNTPIPVDIRLICATNRNLAEMVTKNEFREDLLYRINTIHIEIPPLRKRPEDIVPLANLFIKRFSKKYGKPDMMLTTAAEQKLQQHYWKENSREWEHCIEKAIIVCDEQQISPAAFQLKQQPEYTVAPSGTTLEAMENRMISQALNDCNGNLSAVASQLGITRQTLYNKMKKYGL